MDNVKSQEEAGLNLPNVGLKRSTLRQEVTDILRWRIIQGEIAPGTRITEERVSKDMGISRGPVRESLRELENEGLVLVEAYRGAVVTETSEDELRHVLIPMRLILEQYAASLAIDLLKDEDFEVLSAITLKMREAAAGGGPDALRQLVDLDVDFHRYVVEFGAHFHTAQLWTSIQPRIRRTFYHLGLRHRDPAVIAQEHEELLEALRSRDPNVVSEAITVHAFTSPLQLLEAGTRYSPEK